MKLKDDQQKVYALTFPNKLVSFYLNFILKYIYFDILIPYQYHFLYYRNI